MNTSTLRAPIAATEIDSEQTAHNLMLQRARWRTRLLPAFGVFVLLFGWWAIVVGLNVKHLYALTFGIGSACVAVAGCMMVLLVDVTPSLGPAYTLLAFVTVIVGGLGSMPGALVGGILIGVSEALAGLLIAPSAKSMFSFGLLILVLLLRPQGLLGKRA